MVQKQVLITFAAFADRPPAHKKEAPRKRLRELRSRPENDHSIVVTVEVFQSFENISKLKVEGVAAQIQS
jgi:hypothetical protein